MNNIELLFGGDVALFWVAIGVVALIVEVLTPSGFFISFSLSALVTGALYFLLETPPTFLTRATCFTVLGVLLIVPLRMLLVRLIKRKKDINDY